MKNTQKGFAPILIIIIGIVFIGGGVYVWNQKNNFTPIESNETSTQSSISDVIITDATIFNGSFVIKWKSTNIEKVNLYLVNTKNNTSGNIATNTENNGTYYYEIEDIAAWRDYDGAYKVVVSSATDPSVKAESTTFPIGRPCSPDVCDTVSQTVSAKKYQGRFYLISYPSDWALREVNADQGRVQLYPDSKTEAWMRKEISSTDVVHVSYVKEALTKKGDQEIVLSNGNVIYVNNKVGRVEGGTENAVTYYVPVSAQAYVQITSGESNKAVIDAIAKSIVVQG